MSGRLPMIYSSEEYFRGIKKGHKETLSSDSENACSKIDDPRISDLFDICRHLFVVRNSLHYLFRIIGGNLKKEDKTKRELLRVWAKIGDNVVPDSLETLTDDPTFFVWLSRQVGCSPSLARKIILQDLEKEKNHAN